MGCFGHKPHGLFWSQATWVVLVTSHTCVKLKPHLSTSETSVVSEHTKNVIVFAISRTCFDWNVRVELTLDMSCLLWGVSKTAHLQLSMC